MRFVALMGAGIAALLASHHAAVAHHPGGTGNVGGAGPINTIAAATLGQGQSVAAIMFEMTGIAAFSDRQLADFAGRHIHAHSLDRILSPSVAYAYGLTNDLTVSARLPYVRRTDIREGEHHHAHGGGAVNEVVERGDAEGLGDLVGMLQWRILDNRASGTAWALLAGLKAPTGNHSRTDVFGAPFELEFQPGSGSWDWMLGAAVTQRLGRWSFDANVLHTFVATGAQDTGLGDRLQYNLAASYRLSLGGGSGAAMHAGVLPEPMRHGGPRAAAAPAVAAGPDAHVDATGGPALDLVVEINGEWHARQTIAGVVDPNSGGNVTYLAPGLRLSVDRWATFVSVGVPIAGNLYGIQAEPDYRVTSGVAVNF